jgi:hypothetical protein
VHEAGAATMPVAREVKFPSMAAPETSKVWMERTTELRSGQSNSIPRRGAAAFLNRMWRRSNTAWRFGDHRRHAPADIGSARKQGADRHLALEIVSDRSL